MKQYESNGAIKKLNRQVDESTGQAKWLKPSVGKKKNHLNLAELHLLHCSRPSPD